MKYLITGINSGLGKYLLKNLPNSLGLDRDNFNEIKNAEFDIIIHCAFNKENVISDYRKYIEDNIFLITKLQNLRTRKFVYISTIDVYNGPQNTYSLFKIFAESLLNNNDLCIRCSMLVGDTMKDNHLTKLFKSESNITLSGDSIFNYVLMDDLSNFFLKEDILKLSGTIDFVANDNLKLEEVKILFKSNTNFGNFIYKVPDYYKFPIYKIYKDYNQSSINNLKKYFI